MGDGLTLVQTGITVAGTITAAIIAALIGVYFKKKVGNGSETTPNSDTPQLPPPQITVVDGNNKRRLTPPQISLENSDTPQLPLGGTTSESPPTPGETNLRLPPQVQEGQQIPAPTPSVVKGVYWFSYSEMGAADIDATLYTHIFCAFAEIDHYTNKVTISNGSNAPYISSFTSTFQRSNPSVSTILSIGGKNYSTMASSTTSRQSFIISAIELAKKNNFCGLDINWQYPEGTVGMANYAALLTELRDAVHDEAITSGSAPLLLTAVLYFSATLERDTFPVESIKRNLNWINLMNYDYHGPSWEPRFTAAPAALRDRKSKYNTESGINCWLHAGLPASKIALGLPSYGRAWKLVDSNINGLGVGVAADGQAVGNEIEPDGGAIAYIDIKKFIERNKAITHYDHSVVSNYCYAGKTWIGYDDVESVKVKVSFAKARGLLGYIFWSVSDDDENFVLCRTANDALG